VANDIVRIQEYASEHRPVDDVVVDGELWTSEDGGRRHRFIHHSLNIQFELIFLNLFKISILTVSQAYTLMSDGRCHH
jgi:hypothetical protein